MVRVAGGTIVTVALPVVEPPGPEQMIANVLVCEGRKTRPPFERATALGMVVQPLESFPLGVCVPTHDVAPLELHDTQTGVVGGAADGETAIETVGGEATETRIPATSHWLAMVVSGT
jgi:hypothetical protein